MLKFLFRGLTADGARGAALFDAVTREARRRAWYAEGAIPDTLDGRFAVLSTLAALAIVRLEGEREAGNAASVALTERFVHVMESEHRELGLGDPTLGKTVRKLVAMLARRVELARTAEGDWIGLASDALYKAEAGGAPLRSSAGALEQFAARLDATTLADLEEGTIR